MTEREWTLGTTVSETLNPVGETSTYTIYINFSTWKLNILYSVEIAQLYC